MPEFDWRLGDSDQYRYYYVRGRRVDGLEVKITPETVLENSLAKLKLSPPGSQLSEPACGTCFSLVRRYKPAWSRE